MIQMKLEGQLACEEGFGEMKRVLSSDLRWYDPK